MLEQVLVDHNCCVLLLQVLLFEPCLLKDYLELCWKFLHIESLRDWVPAIVLLPYEYIWFCQFELGQAVFSFFFFNDLPCISSKREFIY